MLRSIHSQWGDCEDIKFHINPHRTWASHIQLTFNMEFVEITQLFFPHWRCELMLARGRAHLMWKVESLWKAFEAFGEKHVKTHFASWNSHQMWVDSCKRGRWAAISRAQTVISKFSLDLNWKVKGGDCHGKKDSPIFVGRLFVVSLYYETLWTTGKRYWALRKSLVGSQNEKLRNY